MSQNPQQTQQQQQQQGSRASHDSQACSSSASRPQASPISSNLPDASQSGVPLSTHNSSGSMSHSSSNHPAPSNQLATPPGSQSTTTTAATSGSNTCGHYHPLHQQAPHFAQQQYNFQSGFHNLVAAAATIAQQSQELHKYPSYEHHYSATQPWGPTLTALQAPNKQRPYTTGVDELILAAKIEESSSRAAANSSGSLLPPPPQLPTVNPASYSSYLPPMSAAASQSSYNQQSAFLAPYAPYVPTGRGLGYSSSLPTAVQSSNRDTMLQFPTPRNKSELELYSLLEKANLLQYFETFLKFGGDDVQQLSDADEDEFLEIMKLIGMTNKPLHIRRFQKALSEWRDSQSVHDSIDTSFKRPNVSCGSEQEQSNSFGARNLYYSQFTGDRMPFRSSGFMVESPAPTPTNSEISQPPFPANEPAQQQQQYCTPLEVIVGAPKRPRLMDSIKPRDLTKTYHSDIPTPDERQLNVRQAIIDKRKRVKMGLDQQQQQQQQQQPPQQPPARVSALNRSYDDDDNKFTPISNSPTSPKWDTESSCGSTDGCNRKDDEPIIEVDSNPRKKPSVRTSLLARFNNSASDKQLVVVPERLSSSPINKSQP